VADLEGAEPAPPPSPLGDGLTPSLTIMLANAKFLSFYFKTWYSEYSKWLPPVDFWQFQSASNSFSVGASPRMHWGSLRRSPDLLAGLMGPHF